MNATWIDRLRGYVWLEVRGLQLEGLLNELTAAGIYPWRIMHQPDGKLRFGLSVPDFFRLRPILKRTGSRVHVLSRHGLPFQMERLSRRKTFAVGMIGFAAALFLLSMLVWKVEIDGDSRIAEEKIRQAIEAEGIYKFQWSFRLDSAASLSQKLTHRLPDAAWVGVEKKGTVITITVVDSTKPEQKPLDGPSDLVAKQDAVVTKVIAESGRPKVERNDRVRKGDVLVSGWLGEGERSKAVTSKGTVMGLVWYEYKVASPLTITQAGYTGASKWRNFLVIGNRALQISGYGQDSYLQSQSRYTFEKFRIGGWQLPLGFMKEYEHEVVDLTRQLTEGQAKEAGVAAARADALAKGGPGATIKAENILHEHIESGKVMVTILFEMEQSIATQRPIVQSTRNQGE